MLFQYQMYERNGFELCNVVPHLLGNIAADHTDITKNELNVYEAAERLRNIITVSYEKNRTSVKLYTTYAHYEAHKIQLIVTYKHVKMLYYLLTMTDSTFVLGVRGGELLKVLEMF